MRNVLYLGWIGFNNLGDEWMWEMFRDMAAAELDPAEYRIVPSLPSVDWKNVAAYDSVVLGGGSLIIPGYVELLHRAMELGKKTVIWGSGHDRLNRLLPGEGGAVVSDAAKESDDYRRKLDEIVAYSGYTGVRGPWTLRYLSELGVRTEGVDISGDSAMLMAAPEPLLPEAAEANATQAAVRRIGINWGTSYNRIYGGSEAYVEDALAEAAKALIAQGFDIYLYSVWGPDREALLRLYGKIGIPEKTVLDTNVYGAEQYVKLLQTFEATLNFKLHANLLSAVAGVPFGCIGYRFKSFDLLCGLGLPERIVAADDSKLAARLAELALVSSQERARLAGLLAGKKQETRDSLIRPFREGLL
ncbi:polysaccharide pyruvyl transferase family protein [Paenibacillus methanolicus]|uniref:Polysaccharide pyruvyl transferase WcaK-like protein n=1 Tax=Paenibacillus methanolicus TaxID=582686 RepID=A0A5S5C6J5_9BACL|nr:polysaccharide pyruvyl transferase family protein [Paenibacillus methanolicus]TYP73950.1 polysaccharide pyruvyl transferase WcaK-like protein [Paenibacillus methanolicus]